MAKYLIETTTGDVADGAATKQTVRGPCTVLVVGTFGAATVSIYVGSVGGTRQLAAIFDVTDADSAEFAGGRGPAKLIDMPEHAEYDVSASIAGSGDHSLSVEIIN